MIGAPISGILMVCVTSSLPMPFSLDDPAYYLINWIVADEGLSIVWVNLFCAAIVCCGVHAFAGTSHCPGSP